MIGKLWTVISMSWNHSWSNLLKAVLTTKIVDSGRKLKADLKDKDAVYWKRWVKVAVKIAKEQLVFKHILVWWSSF